LGCSIPWGWLQKRRSRRRLSIVVKNIQIIDGAENCSYSIFSVTEEEFRFLFPEIGQDVEFIEDVLERSSDEIIEKMLTPVWRRPVKKTEACGIHGTLFYQLHWTRIFYPTKKEAEMKFVSTPRPEC
jgi:hypothetical protein